MKRLRARLSKDKAKVVNSYYDTICECLPNNYYADQWKTTINEMVHAWNESFGKGLDVTTGLPPILRHDHSFYLAHNQEFATLEAVEKYAHGLGLRITLTQTVKDSHVYLVTLTK